MNEMERATKCASENDLDELMAQYDEFERLYSIFPNEVDFPRLNATNIIDEEKSVKWNREEVERRNDAYNAELKRRSDTRRDVCQFYKDSIKRLLGEECFLSSAESEIVWCKAWKEGHACGIYDIVSCFRELADMVSDLKAVWKKENALACSEEQARDDGEELER